MRRLVIAGGGIGGLTTALCLAKFGWSVLVLEQADEFSTAGAGIQLSPNCSRVLHDLGLQEALRARGFLPHGAEFRHWRDGRVIAASTFGTDVAQRYGAPYYHMHRGDLLEILLSATQEHANIEMRTGAAVTGFSHQDNGTVLVEINDDTEAALALVGADGIHSLVRRGLWGDQQPVFTGNVAWRMMVPTAKLPQDMVRPMSTVWWGPGKHFVHYYVRGGEYVNCVCVVEKTGWQVESWTQQGEVEELHQDFAGWHPHVVELIEQADESALYKWALFDRPPMPQWGRGCVTLLGDACHPTLPFMAQGAAMAIEDAAVLSRCLARHADVVQALQRYEDLRRQRTARIQIGSRRNARVFHLSGVAAWLRNLAASRARQSTMDGLYRYNPLTAAEQTKF